MKSKYLGGVCVIVGEIAIFRQLNFGEQLDLLTR